MSPEQQMHDELTAALRSTERARAAFDRLDAEFQRVTLRAETASVVLACAEGPCCVPGEPPLVVDPGHAEPVTVPVEPWLAVWEHALLLCALLTIGVLAGWVLGGAV